MVRRAAPGFAVVFISSDSFGKCEDPWNLRTWRPYGRGTKGTTKERGTWDQGPGTASAAVIPRERRSRERRDLLATGSGRLRCRASRSRRFARDDRLSVPVIPHERSECRDLPATGSGRLRCRVSRSRRFARDDSLSFPVIPHERSECRDLLETDGAGFGAG